MNEVTSMIFYFSSTGNDKYAAARIAESTKDTIYSVYGCMHDGHFSYTLKEGENFGLIIPTYFGGFPNIIIDFLEKLDIQWSDGNYVFFVGTYGANCGNIGQEAFRRLEKLGRKPDAAFTIKMVDNWNPYFNMNDKDYISKAESEAESAIGDVVQKISNHVKTDIPAKNMPTILQAFSTRLYHSYCKTRKFAVSSACISCGLCERQCPVNAIKLKDKKPVWVKPECTLCLGCVHRCPVNAISYTKKTVGHGQYFNPNTEPDIR